MTNSAYYSAYYELPLVEAIERKLAWIIGGVTYPSNSLFRGGLAALDIMAFRCIVS